MAKLVDTAVLVTEVIGDTKSLFELQIKLLRAEIQELSTFSKQFILLGALALAALVPAIFFLGMALSEAIALTDLPPWACHSIVFLVLVGASAIPILKAKQLLSSRKNDTP